MNDTYAVLIGINVYADYPEDTLRGCGNDANNLWIWGHNHLSIPQANIAVIKDQKATDDFIIASVLAAGHKAGPGGRLIWSHSSHGSNNPDPTQKDGLQELLCCYNLKEKNGLWVDGYISAKEVGKICEELSFLESIDLIFDCCHAPEGSQLKGLGLTYDRARFMRRSILGLPVRPKLIGAVQSTIPTNLALWSACEPAQTSADAYIDKSWQGAFTAAFLKCWKEGRTRSDIIYHARNWLKANRYQQVPHLYCWKKLAFREVGR